ncbi:MAG: co-chaperone DjlA [Salinisphaeraceae bacterium]|jgi:DnaJ like chaperone protein|nr:co-chaperone DjlA [Salinisphaeraceae bacterium]
MFTGLMIGAAIGYMLGRTPGLLLGAALGFWLGRYQQVALKRSGSVSRAQQQFLDSTFAVMGAICKADGKVSREEIQAAEQMFTRLRLNARQKEAAKEAFRRGKDNDFNLDAEIAKILQISRGQPALTQMFLQVQLSAAAADDTLHPAEREMLLRVAKGLRLSQADMARIEALLRGRPTDGASRPSQQSLDDAYSVLGLASSASESEIKKAYRRLMSQNHPDKLAARGLPESMRDMAEEKTREIGRAYEQIMRARQTS